MTTKVEITFGGSIYVYSIKKGGFKSKRNPTKPTYKVYSQLLRNWLSNKEIAEMGLPDPATVLEDDKE